MFLVAANTRQAIVGQKEWLTTGSSGIQVQFLFSDDWDGLSKFAVFRNAEIEESVIPIALPESNLTELPAENCAAEYVEEKVYVGVYGSDGLGHIIIPTIWVSLGVLKEGAAYEGMDPPQPTPDMWAQILAIAQNAGAENAEAAEKAEAGAKEAASTAQAAAAEVKNLSVDADTLAAGEPATVEKTVDAGTGAVKLKFGIPQGPQGEPMTYEDMTEEQKAELVQGPILDAQNAAVTAVGNARVNAVNAVESAGTTAVNAVNQAGTTQVGNVNQAGTTQVQAVADKGAEVIGSIPPDYSDLAAEVDDLNRQLNDETTGLDTKAPVILETASGAIASFDDGADSMPIRKLVATIEPVQEGSGDQSPDNVRPISGWTGCNFIQRGQNIADGTVIKDIIFNRVATNRRGESQSGWVWFQPNQSDGYPTILGVDAPDKKNKYKFKENTAYTICFASACQSAGNLNIGYTYTDGTYIIIAQDTTSQYTHRIVTDNSKTLKNIWIGNNVTGWTSIGYTTFCVCEGDVALEDIPTQQSAIVPIVFTDPSTGDPLTVYGGPLTLNEDGSADLVSEWGEKVLNGSETWSPNSSYSGNAFYISLHDMKRATNYRNVILCDKAKACGGFTYQDFYDATVGITGFHTSGYQGQNWLYLRVDGVTTASGIKEWLANNPLQVCYQLATPQTYHFSNIGKLKTFLGTNNIWCDTGDVEVTYPADTKLFIEKLTQPTEDDMTADHAISAGTFFMIGNTLYLATSQIAAGGTITPGTNATQLSLADALNQLNT